MTAKEDARMCERCTQKWFAVRSARAPKPRWYDEGGTPWGSGAARVARLEGNYKRSLVDRDRWSRCPNCGSTKVKTVSQRNFVPTAAQTVAPSPPAPANLSAPGTPHNNSPGAENAVWTAVKAFMKVHWRIVLAIFCSIGVVVMPFAGENVGEKVGGTLGYLAGAVIFWTLHLRHVGGPDRSLIPAPPSPRHDEVDMTIEDGWSRRLSSCRMKASVFNEVGAATRSDAVRSWLSAVSDDIDTQLVLAADLAALGRSVEPGFLGDEPANPAAREAWNRLGAFESGLDCAVTSAAQIRLNSLSPATNLDAIRGQLEMLQSQLPSLDTR